MKLSSTQYLQVNKQLKKIEDAILIKLKEFYETNKKIRKEAHRKKNALDTIKLIQ